MDNQRDMTIHPFTLIALVVAIVFFIYVYTNRKVRRLMEERAYVEQYSLRQSQMEPNYKRIDPLPMPLVTFSANDAQNRKQPRDIDIGSMKGRNLNFEAPANREPYRNFAKESNENNYTHFRSQNRNPFAQNLNQSFSAFNKPTRESERFGSRANDDTSFNSESKKRIDREDQYPDVRNFANPIVNKSPRNNQGWNNKHERANVVYPGIIEQDEYLQSDIQDYPQFNKPYQNRDSRPYYEQRIESPRDRAPQSKISHAAESYYNPLSESPNLPLQKRKSFQGIEEERILPPQAKHGNDMSIEPIAHEIPLNRKNSNITRKDSLFKRPEESMAQDHRFLSKEPEAKVEKNETKQSLKPFEEKKKIIKVNESKVKVQRRLDTYDSDGSEPEKPKIEKPKKIIEPKQRGIDITFYNEFTNASLKKYVASKTVQEDHLSVLDKVPLPEPVRRHVEEKKPESSSAKPGGLFVNNNANKDSNAPTGEAQNGAPQTTAPPAQSGGLFGNKQTKPDDSKPAEQKPAQSSGSGLFTNVNKPAEDKPKEGPPQSAPQQQAETKKGTLFGSLGQPKPEESQQNGSPKKQVKLDSNTEQQAPPQFNTPAKIMGGGLFSKPEGQDKPTPTQNEKAPEDKPLTTLENKPISDKVPESIKNSLGEGLFKTALPQANSENKPPSTGLFGFKTGDNSGANAQAPKPDQSTPVQNTSIPKPGGLFAGGTNTDTTPISTGGLFTNKNPGSSAVSTGGLFANKSATTNNAGGENQPAGDAPKKTGLFGLATNVSSNSNSGGDAKPTSGLFGGNGSSGGSGLFGATQNKPASGGLFGNK